MLLQMEQKFVADRAISYMVIYHEMIGSVVVGHTVLALKECRSPNKMFNAGCKMALDASLAVSRSLSLSVRAAQKHHQFVTQCAY